MAFRYTPFESYLASATKAARKSLRIRQRDLADILGCTIVTIWNYESGRSMPSGAYIDLLHRLCREKGITPPDFFITNYEAIQRTEKI